MRSKLFVALALVASALAAHAAHAAHAADVMLGQLARAQAQTKLMKAQLEQKEIAAKLADQGVPVATQSGTPFVGGVFGRKGALYATLLYSDGSRIDARAGSTVPGGYRLVSLTAERVELVAPDGRRVLAAFSAVPPAPPAAPADNAATTPAPAKATD